MKVVWGEKDSFTLYQIHPKGELYWPGWQLQLIQLHQYNQANGCPSPSQQSQVQVNRIRKQKEALESHLRHLVSKCPSDLLKVHSRGWWLRTEMMFKITMGDTASTSYKYFELPKLYLCKCQLSIRIDQELHSALSEMAAPVTAAQHWLRAGKCASCLSLGTLMWK